MISDGTFPLNIPGVYLLNQRQPVLNPPPPHQVHFRKLYYCSQNYPVIDMKPGQRVNLETHLILKQVQNNSQRYKPCWEAWTMEGQRNPPKVCCTFYLAPLTLFGMLIISYRRCVPHRHTHTCKPFAIIQRSSRFGSNSFPSPTSRSTGPTLRSSSTTHHTASLISF